MQDKEQKIQEVIALFGQSHENTQVALRELGLPENSVQLYTSVWPDFNSLLLEELLQVFHNIRDYMVLSLHNRDFSQREIARRLGGSSIRTVNKILKEYTKEKS